MPAPRMLNTPVQVLGRPLIQGNDIYPSNQSNEKGREGLVGGDGRPGRQSEETLKSTNGTATSPVSGASRQPTFATLSSSQQPTSVTATYTVSVQSISSATPRPSGGARVEVESLPGQNQIKPNLDDARLDTPMLPGVNQDTSNMGEVPQPIMPAVAANGLSPPPGPPAMTVDKPLQGQSQVMPPPASPSAPTGPPAPGGPSNPPGGPPGGPGGPCAGPLGPPGMPPPGPASSVPAPPLPPTPSAPSGPPGPPKPPMDGPPMHGLPPTAAAAPPPAPPTLPAVTTSSSNPSTTSTSTSTITTTPSITSSEQTFAPVSSSSLRLSSITSFVTLTRSEQGKENSLPTLAPAGIVSPTTAVTPQAINVGQSLTVIFSSTSAIAAASSTATAAADTQDGSGLHPTMRTLLIVFVILGVLSLVVATIAFMMVRSHRRRSAQQQSMRDLPPSDAPNDRIGVTTHISAGPNENPFLTASEKAIIETASTDGASKKNVRNSSRFSDAVSSFVEKSRSLTYKISP
ncbi:hypothetical protein E8E11_001623 [Didymella keratinophila]|nr:hypothetical protein E8E11_001623 [Didymella keratinophila]